MALNQNLPNSWCTAEKFLHGHIGDAYTASDKSLCMRERVYI